MKIYFIGIGGVAISGLALIAKEKGNRVLGSDSSKSEITDLLKQKGVKVLIGHKQGNLPEDTDLVVYSEAVEDKNPELKKAKDFGIKTLSGAQYLSQIAKDYFLIAVSGMHGKTTTASMAAHLLMDNGFDPTYLIGTKNGSRVGKSKYLVIEADDYQAKLLNYKPDILLLTNIEEEHLDYFKNLNHILETFKKYINQVKGFIVANRDNGNICKILKELKIKNKKLKIETYSLK
ncbi:UDP-N-acetylmuramate--L-alanine ligase, partial [Candidatus Gribaldobacteria bacterium]|nr:UDP-N-acetylmuramate--L-alanine ligase [Candidatus Gribaldobacteria bacterium]